MKFKHTTPEQNLAELRRRFKGAKGLTAAKMARWMFTNLTVAKIKTTFKLSGNEVAELRNRLRKSKDLLDQLEAEAGE